VLGGDVLQDEKSHKIQIQMLCDELMYRIPKNNKCFMSIPFAKDNVTNFFQN
jgi:hypothetical protein